MASVSLEAAPVLLASYIYIYIKREYRYTRSGISTSIVVIFHLGTGAWRDIVISEGGGGGGREERTIEEIANIAEV